MVEPRDGLQCPNGPMEGGIEYTRFDATALAQAVVGRTGGDIAAKLVQY